MKKPKNYYCHRNLSDIVPLDQISPEFEVVQKIGEGSFGQVYKVFVPKTSQILVVKKNKKESQISQQIRILSQLTNSKGFQQLGKHIKLAQNTKDENNNTQIVMGCLGPSLGKIMKKINSMNAYSMKRIAQQLIYKLKQIHSLCYVHRDLKPDNILLGNKYDSHSIYLIDFGLTNSYKKNTEKARKIYQSIIGTAKYCPIASHLGLEQYPKDDLESLGYVLLYLVRGAVPWEQEDGETDEKLFQRIYNTKKNSNIDSLCGGLNCLRKYWTKVKCLKVNQKINYEQLASYFEVSDKNESNCFQFCESCWIRTQKIKKRQISQQKLQIINQPKSNIIRDSILS